MTKITDRPRPTRRPHSSAGSSSGASAPPKWSRARLAVRANDEVPITSVTNGVHTQTWISREIRELLDRYLGPRWARDPSDRDIWEGIEKIPADPEAWAGVAVRGARRIAGLVDEHRERALRTRELATVRRDVPGVQTTQEPLQSKQSGAAAHCRSASA